MPGLSVSLVTAPGRTPPTTPPRGCPTATALSGLDTAYPGRIWPTWIGCGVSELDLAYLDWMRRIRAGSGLSGLDAAYPSWIWSIWIGYGVSGLDLVHLIWMGRIRSGSGLFRLDAAYPKRIRLIQSSRVEVLPRKL
jgi:hypothetical protein